jgi:cytochrome c6
MNCVEVKQPDMKVRTVVFTIVILAATFCLRTAAFAQDAAALYKAKCAACHGADGKADTAVGKKIGVRDFAAPEVQKQSDDELAAIINDGKNKMPSYKKSLKPDQVKELVAMVRSFAKK